MAIESSVMSTGYSPPGRSNGIPKNGTTHSHVEAEEARKPTTSIANGASDTNGVAAPQDLSFDSIEYTIQAFKAGSFIIVLDAPARENEGDLICAAQDFTPAKAAFMIRHTSGLICCPLSPALASSLNLPQMVPCAKIHDGDDETGTAYTISVDAVGDGMTTGISARDRAMTCRKLSELGAQPEAFRRPGHVFPLRAREGGVRARRGHTEATVEFCRLAGKREVGVICEMVDDGEEVVRGEDGMAKRTERTTPGGGMMGGEACLAFGRKWGIRVCTIEALVEYLDRNEGRAIEE